MAIDVAERGGAEEGAASVDASAQRRARAHALLDAVLDADASQASGSALAEALAARASLASIVDGAAVRLVPAWEASGDWTADGSATPVAWLVNHTGAHRSAAAGMRRTALAAARLPEVAAAAAAGTLALSHLRLLVDARREEVAEAFDRDVAELVAAAQQLSADRLSIHLRHWYFAALAELERNAPDPPPGPETDESTLTVVASFQGRGLLRADLTAADLGILREAIEARIDTWRRAGMLVEDTRTFQELQAAALMDLVTDGSTSTRRGQARPLLIAVATLDALLDRAGSEGGERDRWRAEVLGGGPIGRASLRRLMEHANIVLVVTDDEGQPLHVGRTRRLATAAMLAALLARGRGTCEFPGCQATHHRAHAHHLKWWRNGGETAIENLALLCPSHHRLIHAGGFTVARGPTGLEFHRPDGALLHPPPFGRAP